MCDNYKIFQALFTAQSLMHTTAVYEDGLQTLNYYWISKENPQA